MPQHLRAMFSPRGETRLEPGLRSAWNFLEDSLQIPLDDIEIGVARRILRRGSASFISNRRSLLAGRVRNRSCAKGGVDGHIACAAVPVPESGGGAVEPAATLAPNGAFAPPPHH